MSRKFMILTAIVFIGFGVAIPWIVIADNRAPTTGGASSGSGAQEAPAATGGAGNAAGGGGVSSGGTQKAAGGAEGEGKQIFTQSCGTCHTLADAGTAGKVGPVLDQIKPDEKRVLKALKIGGTGSGTMPAGLVTGKEAQAVAKYVSSVAGK
jgi:cytochrome c6